MFFYYFGLKICIFLVSILSVVLFEAKCVSLKTLKTNKYSSAILALFSITIVKVVLLFHTNSVYIWKALLYLCMHPVGHRNKIRHNVLIAQ